MKKILSLMAAAVITVGVSSTAYAKNSYNVNRLYGVDRYETSASISNEFNNGTLQSVIVASGRDFPDALAGSVLSKKLNAPIVLAGNNISESGDCIQYINTHLDKNGTVYILGGQASVNEEFVNYMNAQGYKNFVRLGGRDRFDTNKYIVNFMNVEKSTPVVIANAYGFADALSVSSIAASKGYPIIMTSNANLSPEAKDMIKNIDPSQIYIIGGYASVGDSVINEIKALLPSLDSNKITKLAGQDRYETSLSVCKYFDLDTDTAVLANGTNFPDALSGSALAAKLNAPIVLTDGQDITKQRDFMDSKSYKNLILLGGFGSVDFPVEYSLKGPDNITAKEKDYINKLLGFCENYTTESTNASNYTDDIFNEIMSEDTLAILEDPNKMADGLDSFIQAYKNFNTYLEKYKQNLINLRDGASNLQNLNGLESLKAAYVNNINVDIQGTDKFVNLINSYVDVFTTLKDAINSNDMNKIEQVVQKLEQVNMDDVNEITSLGNGQQGINSLKEKLIKIKNSME